MHILQSTHSGHISRQRAKRFHLYLPEQWNPLNKTNNIHKPKFRVREKVQTSMKHIHNTQKEIIKSKRKLQKQNQPKTSSNTDSKNSTFSTQSKRNDKILSDISTTPKTRNENHCHNNKTKFQLWLPQNKIIQFLQNVKCMSRKAAEKAEMKNSHAYSCYTV